MTSSFLWVLAMTSPFLMCFGDDKLFYGSRGDDKSVFMFLDDFMGLGMLDLYIYYL